MLPLTAKKRVEFSTYPIWTLLTWVAWSRKSTEMKLNVKFCQLIAMFICFFLPQVTKCKLEFVKSDLGKHTIESFTT